MIRARRHAIVILLTVLAPAAHGQMQPSAQEPWVDYASGDYRVFPDLPYAEASGTRLTLDLYEPKIRPSPLPTVVHFHGGGWVAGRKEADVLELLPYLSLGCAVLNVEYRLAGTAPAPAAVEDCRCALRWVVDHAAQYNFDTSKIVLTGGSAGGHLALITGMLPEGSPFDRPCPTTDKLRWRSGTEPRVRVAAIVNWFGITDVAELLEGSNAKHYAMEWFGSMPDAADLARRLSPITYVRSGLPPILTVHGDRDDIVPFSQAERLHAALGKAGVPNKLIRVPGGGHDGFSRQVLVESYGAIREFLRAYGVLRRE